MKGAQGNCCCCNWTCFLPNLYETTFAATRRDGIPQPPLRRRLATTPGRYPTQHAKDCFTHFQKCAHL